MHPAGLFCTNLKKAVDNSPFSWYNNIRRQGRHRLWGISSAGRALAWHARGQRFDPAILHQKSTVLRRKYGAFLFAEAAAAVDFLIPKKTPSLLIGISYRNVHISMRRCLIAIFKNSAYRNGIFAICSLRMLLVH